MVEAEEQLPVKEKARPPTNYIVTEKMMRKHYNRFETDDEIGRCLHISTEVVRNWRERDRLPKWVSAVEIGVTLRDLRNLSLKQSILVKRKMAKYFFNEICREFPRKKAGNKSGGRIGRESHTPPVGGVLREIQRRMCEQRLCVDWRWVSIWWNWQFQFNLPSNAQRAHYDLPLYEALDKIATKHS
jgi:hypothetical protein